ncbi:unnamed protein product [Caenorhabditis brenneri]
MDQVIQEDQEELDIFFLEKEEIEESNEKLNVLNDVLGTSERIFSFIADPASQEILRMRREWMSHANLSRLGDGKKGQRTRTGA